MELDWIYRSGTTSDFGRCAHISAAVLRGGVVGEPAGGGGGAEFESI